MRRVAFFTTGSRHIGLDKMSCNITQLLFFTATFQPLFIDFFNLILPPLVNIGVTKIYVVLIKDSSTE